MFAQPWPKHASSSNKKWAPINLDQFSLFNKKQYHPIWLQTIHIWDQSLLKKSLFLSNDQLHLLWQVASHSFNVDFLPNITRPAFQSLTLDDLKMMGELNYSHPFSILLIGMILPRIRKNVSKAWILLQSQRKNCRFALLQDFQNHSVEKKWKKMRWKIFSVLFWIKSCFLMCRSSLS